MNFFIYLPFKNIIKSSTIQMYIERFMVKDISGKGAGENLRDDALPTRAREFF